jgi:hypothetical protein
MEDHGTNITAPGIIHKIFVYKTVISFVFWKVDFFLTFWNLATRSEIRFCDSCSRPWYFPRLLAIDFGLFLVLKRYNVLQNPV